jgi:hypothetical protein
VDFSATQVVSAAIPAVGSTVSVDVTNIAKQWQNGTLSNNGVVLYGSGAFLGAALYSPTYGASGPKLTVTYSTP